MYTASHNNVAPPNLLRHGIAQDNAHDENDSNKSPAKGEYQKPKIGPV
jgi:hypothetical protein